MISIAASRPAVKFKQWTQETCPRAPLIYFRIAFAAVWLTYDVLDFSLSATHFILWNVGNPSFYARLAGTQLVLIAAELALLWGFKSRTAAFVAFLARGYQAFFFPLNDFLYFCVASLILSQCDCDHSSQTETLAWPRDVFVLQTAWIYFCTAILKLGPNFISGGDLYVRQNYLDARGWIYPSAYAHWIHQLSANHELAWLGFIGEITLSAVLFSWWWWPSQRKNLSRAATAIAIGIHGYGAISLNVFFFGLSMVAQVGLLTSAKPFSLFSLRKQKGAFRPPRMART